MDDNAPIDVESAIRLMLQRVFGIDHPYPSQLEGISYLAPIHNAHDPSPPQQRALLVVQKTSFGKSLIVLGTAALLKKVTLCVVPILALGEDQTQKVRSKSKSKKIIAFHLDEIKGQEYMKMKAFMETWDKDSLNRLAVVLYCSPQALQPDQPWHKVILGPNGLASKQLISLLAFDEADCIPMDGRFFRPEFAALKANLIDKIESLQHESMPPIVAMTATLTQTSCLELEKVLGVTFTKTLWGFMDRRHIDLNIQIVGQPTSKLSTLLLPYLDSDGDGSKFMVFTHEQTRADGALVETVNKVLQCNNVEGCARAFTGTTGLMEKRFLIGLFAGERTHPLCNLRGIVATKSAIRGVSSHDLRLVIMEGMLMNMDDFMQLQGRVGRAGTRTNGPHDSVHVLLSYSHFRKLCDCICDGYKENKEHGRFLFDQLLLMLEFLVLPRRCYHISSEELYEHPQNRSNLNACGDFCPFCRGDHNSFTGHVEKEKLVKMLKTIFHNGPLSLDNLYKALNTDKNKDSIFIAPKSYVKAGHVQALLLQLIASGIIMLDLRSNMVNWAFSSDPGTYAYETDRSWDHLNVQ